MTEQSITVGSEILPDSKIRQDPNLVASLQHQVIDWYYSLLLLLSTCACVEYYGRALEILVKKVPVHCIHGKMKHKRNKIFADFRALKR